MTVIGKVRQDQPEKTGKGFCGNEVYRPSASLVSNRIRSNHRALTLGQRNILRERNTYRLLARIKFQVIKPVSVSTVARVLLPLLRNIAAVRYNFQRGLTVLQHWLYELGSLHSQLGENLLLQPVGSTADGNLRSNTFPTQ